MTLEEFVSKGAAAAAAVDEMLERCMCRHTRAEHRQGLGCTAGETAGKLRNRICGCTKFRAEPDPELEAVKQAIRERSEDLEQERRRHSPPRFVIVRRGKKSEQLGALHSHYKDLDPATFPRGAWVWVWFSSPQRWAFNASDREVLRDATADDLVFWRCDAEAQRGAP